MIPAWDKTGMSEPVFFIRDKQVTETEYRDYLRSKGWSYRNIEQFFKMVRDMRFEDD